MPFVGSVSFLPSWEIFSRHCSAQEAAIRRVGRAGETSLLTSTGSWLGFRFLVLVGLRKGSKGRSLLNRARAICTPGTSVGPLCPQQRAELQQDFKPQKSLSFYFLSYSRTQDAVSIPLVFSITAAVRASAVQHRFVASAACGNPPAQMLLQLRFAQQLLSAYLAGFVSRCSPHWCSPGCCWGLGELLQKVVPAMWEMHTAKARWGWGGGGSGGQSPSAVCDTISPLL